MNFQGFQKLTLLDYPGKTACTVFTAGCNFRCPFCHNAPLVTDIDNSVSYPEDEILTYLNRRRGLLDGICITGGEPLLQNGIIDFMKRAKEAGFAVKLDTNGSFPEKLREAVLCGACDYVAMDIKNRPERYAETVGVPGYDMAPVKESVDFLLSGAVDYEFRTTVVAELHTEADIEGAAKFISGAKRYFLQNFTDSGNLIGEGLSPVPKETLQKMAIIARKYVAETATRGI